MSKIRTLKRSLNQIQQVRRELSQALRGAVAGGWQSLKSQFETQFNSPGMRQGDALLALAERLKADIMRGAAPGGLPVLQELQRSLDKAYSLGANLASDLTGKPMGGDFLGSSVPRAAASLVESHVTRMGLTIASGLEMGSRAGVSLGAAKKALQAPLIEAQVRIDAVAGTEVFSAHAGGVQSIIKSDPDIAELWLAVLEGNVCPFCLARHGQLYHPGEAFVPVHPNCACVLVPVTKEDLGVDGFYDQALLLENELWADVGNKKRNSGAAPFERRAGLEAPQPWLDF